MRVSEFENIVRVLNAADVRYLVVGGIAVVAHGYGRMTFDLDLVLQLQPENVIRGFRALDTLIRMKEVAGRPKDLDDVAHLRMAAND